MKINSRTLIANFVAEDIRIYFGEGVALYFIFLGFYTTALLLPTALGILQTFLSSETLPFFCIFNVIWVTVFLEVSTLSAYRLKHHFCSLFGFQTN